jgi:septal ring factor EnvC (AmiA/AmiB activator)
MPEPASLTAFLGSIKTAKEIIQAIIDAPKSLEKAELQYKIASLTKSLAELETQAVNFNKQIQEKDSEIERLKKLLEIKTETQDFDLPEECISILKILSEGLDYPTTENIASAIRISKQKAEYFLDILKNHMLLTESLNYNSGVFYEINKDGRKFLAEKDLL